MRQFQVGVFVAGILAFLGALVYTGQMMGDTLWRAGVAILLIDFGFIKLWPGGKG